MVMVMGESSEIACSRSDATTRLLSAEEDGDGDINIERKRPKEPWKGEYVKSVVYAGLDAIITCFSLISSISASRPSSDVLVLGFANLVADAISMGLGDYLSCKAEQEVIAEKRAATKWDVMNRGSREQTELVRHYEALGMESSDAVAAVKLFAKYKNVLVDQRMEVDKGTVPADREVEPWKNGVVTLVSFLIFGSTPLLSFIILIPFTHSDSVKFVGSCIVTALVLALLGLAKASIAAKNYVSSVAIILFNGSIAAAAAFSLGWSLKHFTTIQD